MTDGEIITSGDGINRDALVESKTYVALVTNSFLSSDNCIGEMRDAFALKKPMYAVIKNGTVLPENFDTYNWKDKFYFTNERDLEMIAEKIKDLGLV
jgi:hypothetical protein